MNEGKLKYDNIKLPGGLDAAIDRGLRRAAGKRRSRRLISVAAGTAAALCLMLGAANVAPVYAFAEDIPLLGDIVRVFHFGSGGEITDGVNVDAEKLGRKVELKFTNGGSETDSAPHYNVRQLEGPGRLVITLSGVRGMDFEAVQDALMASGAVSDVYRSIILDDSRVELNVVLSEGWSCEIGEYENPGSLLLSFAYSGEPGDSVYYLRTESMPFGEALGLLCEEYLAEGVTQVRDADGSFYASIGQYESEEEAEAALEALLEAHENAPFSVAGYGE